MPSPLMSREPELVSSPDTTWRTRNLGALLFRATDRCVRDKLRLIHASGFPALSDAQLTLFHHLDPAGMRLTDLAAAANLTKQSMIELVDRAEAMDLIARRPDPQDGRAKTVGLTPEGQRLLASLREGIVAVERDVRDVFGATFLAEVKTTLRRYAEMGEAQTGDEEAWRTDNAARIFAMTARRFSREALAVAHERGWGSVSEVLLSLFRNLDLDGTRLTDIAARARMTKQSMRELVDRAEALGFVARQPDPADGRAKVIAFTPTGLAMLEAVRHGLVSAEARFDAQSGTAFSARLKACLLDYAAGHPS